MKARFKYSDLERHFTVPKGGIGFSHKRIPRKKKKEINKIIGKYRYDFLTLNQKLWFCMGLANPDYRDFLIKQICKDE